MPRGEGKGSYDAAPNHSTEAQEAGIHPGAGEENLGEDCRATEQELERRIGDWINLDLMRVGR